MALLKKHTQMNIQIKYSITLFIIFLAFGGTLHAQYARDTIIVTDTLSTQILNEVTVNAKRMVNDGDHVNLYLSEENKSFGTNALDAVSTMPLFTTALNATTLSSWDRQDVFVLINGVPSSATTLRGYKADMIKKVEYYQNAPAQYMMFTTGPLINVEIKKVHDRLYMGYFNTTNAVTMGYGRNQGMLSYRDSLNMVRVDYFGSYSNSTKIRDYSSFDYREYDISTNYDGKSHRRWSNTYVSSTYQRYEGAHLFNAEINYNTLPAKDRERRSVHIESPDGIYDGNGEDIMKSGTKNLSLILFYNYTFKNKAFMAFNVVNTLGWAHSESGQWLTGNGIGPVNDYDTYSSLKNRSYVLSAQGVFVYPDFLGGRFQAGARYTYKHMNQHTAKKIYSPRSNEEHLTIGQFWRFPHGFSFYPIIGAEIDTQHFLGESRTRVNPHVRLLGSWNGEGKCDGLSVQLTASLRQEVPTLADISPGKTYLDPWFISTGNPYLNSYWWLYSRLAVAYFIPNSNNMVAIKFTPTYRHRPYVPIISNEGDYMSLHPENIKNTRGFEASLNGSWSIFKWLKLEPYVEFYSKAFRTPMKQVKWTYWRAGGGIVATFGDFESVIAINTPTKEWEGDILNRGSWQCALTAQYKTGNWAFGAEYHFLGRNDYRLAHTPTFTYYDNSRLIQHYKLVELIAIYSFSIGKARGHASKTIYDSTNETGLTKYNSAGPAK